MKKPGYYHNACDTIDAPAILLLDESTNEFSEGPFLSYADAKKDMIEFYTNMIEGYQNALRLTKSIKIPVFKGK